MYFIGYPDFDLGDNWIDFHTTVGWVIYWGLKPWPNEHDPTKWAIYVFANYLNDLLIGKISPAPSSLATLSQYSSSSNIQNSASTSSAEASSKRSHTGEAPREYGKMFWNGLKRVFWDLPKSLFWGRSSIVDDASKTSIDKPFDYNSRQEPISDSSPNDGANVDLSNLASLNTSSSDSSDTKTLSRRAFTEITSTCSLFIYMPFYYLDSSDHSNFDLKRYFNDEIVEIQGKRLRSTFVPDDVLDRKLEDMVWLGAGGAGLRGMFANNPPLTKAANGILEHMTRNYYFQELMRLYKISFRNDSDFHLAIVGQILNLSFKDVDGLSNSKIEKILQIKPKPEVNAKMHLLPKECEWPFGTITPDLVSILRCIHHNVNEPAVMLRPGTHMLGDERYVGKIEMEGSDLIQLADENFSHGRCMAIKESQVVVAIFEPDHYENFFLINLNLSVPEQADPNDEHDDPCGTLFACIPSKRGIQLVSFYICTNF